MEFWDTIINTAMIGTDKKNIGTNEFPEEMHETISVITENNKIDNEEKFLQFAALAFNYRQCGIIPIRKEEITLSPAPSEDKHYVKKESIQVLKDILSEENNTSLLKIWLEQCVAKNNIVDAEFVPMLLSKAEQHKKLQLLITACCGKRGEWLSQFNDNWNFTINQTDEDSWQTGTPEQRKNTLREIRKTNPLMAREWLQQTWQQEDANNKAGFLEILSVNIGEEDIPFLEAALSEKSKKVKEEAFKLLKQIPTSTIVLQYQNLIEKTVSLKKEKTLLGLSSKTSLQFRLPEEIDESIFKSGIEKLSSNKDFTDEEHIIYQLMQSVPPVFWEKHFESSAQDIIHYLQKDSIGKKMIPALVIAIQKFKNQSWAISFMQYSDIFYIDIIPLIPLRQQNTYSNQFFEKFPDSIIQYALQREQEWDDDLARKIMKYTAKNPYQYNRSFYNQHIHLIPAFSISDIGKCEPDDQHFRAIWQNTSEFITKLLALKNQTLKSFNE